MAEFNLGQAFYQAFGYKPDPFNPQFSTVVGDTSSDYSRKEYGDFGSPYYASDAFGREYFLPVAITFADETQTATGVFGTNPTGVLTTWNLPYPIISVSSRKTIIETSLTERNGTVKELINTQGYAISIKGLIIAATNEFPETDVKTMRLLYEGNVAVRIDCPLTDIFLNATGKMIVITDLQFPEVRGVKNVRAYELTCVSDVAFNLNDIS